MTEPLENHIGGAVLGTAVGDALGLPYEGVSRRRAPRLLGPAKQHRFVVGRGMVSDDTEHTCMVAQALIASGCDDAAFARNLARRLRWWLLGLPAGVGFATLKSILRLWIGFSPKNSGVFSAGNGPAMRAAVIGAAVEDLDLLHRLITASTRVTHTDPKAEHGAHAVALAARQAMKESTLTCGDFLELVDDRLPDDEDKAELLALLNKVSTSVNNQQTTAEFADSLGLGHGVTGYVYHTVPMAIHAWLSHPRDYQAAVSTIIECGGDADTTGAIVGGIVGAGVGVDGIPKAWLDGIWEWPRSVCWMQELAGQLTESRLHRTNGNPCRLPVHGVLARNLLFVVLVLGHGFRRILPPY